MKLPQYRNPADLIDRMPDTSWFTHAQIFDDVLIVANCSTSCFVLKTTEGLILIDAIYPKVEMYNAIVEAIKDISYIVTLKIFTHKNHTRILFAFTPIIFVYNLS